MYLCLITDTNSVTIKPNVGNVTAAQKSNHTTTKAVAANTNAQHTTASVVAHTSSQDPEKHTTVGAGGILKSGQERIGESVAGKFIVAEVNTSVTLTCSLLGNVQEWYQNDKQITIQDENLYTIFMENGTLLVRKVGQSLFSIISITLCKN